MQDSAPPNYADECHWAQDQTTRALILCRNSREHDWYRVEHGGTPRNTANALFYSHLF
jgi:hypothetical protein